jgi:hypothetical protein
MKRCPTRVDPLGSRGWDFVFLGALRPINTVEGTNANR